MWRLKEICSENLELMNAGIILRHNGKLPIFYKRNLDRIQYEVHPETKWMIYYHSEDDLKRLKSVFGITGISRKFEVYFLKRDNFWDR